MNGRNTENPEIAEREFLTWFAQVQGTPVTDADTAVQRLTETAEGEALTVPVPGVNGPGDDLDTAKRAEAARRGYTGQEAEDYASLLKGETPREIAESAVKLDGLRDRLRQSTTPKYSASNPSPAYLEESDPGVLFIRRLTGNYS